MVSAVATIPIREQLVDAVGNGARTVTAIAEATGLTKTQVNANICHLKNDGTVVTTADGFTLRAGHKMPVKVTKPKPGEAAPDWAQKPASERTFRPVSQREMGCALSPSERALMGSIEPSPRFDMDTVIQPPQALIDAQQRKSLGPEIQAVIDEHRSELYADPSSPELIAAQRERIAAQEADNSDGRETDAEFIARAAAYQAELKSALKGNRSDAPAARLPEVTEQPPRAAAVRSAPDPLIVANLGEYLVLRKSDVLDLLGAVEIVGRWRQILEAAR